MAPFSEEFTFRACMVPVLLGDLSSLYFPLITFACVLGYYSHFWAIIISPLFFGVAHFHHMVERIRKGQDVMTSFLVSMFQFAYTTIFGMYSAFLFVKTGHFAAPFIVHAYCNFMGFPDFMEVVNSEPRKRLVLMFLFVMGVVLFYCSYEVGENIWKLTKNILTRHSLFTDAHPSRIVQQQCLRRTIVGNVSEVPMDSTSFKFQVNIFLLNC